MTNASAAPTRAPRFRTIDGLRGIAALSVAIFHFNGAIVRSAPHWLPMWASAIANNGFLGVEVFFVISGFVIAYSVRDGDYSARYLGWFALRRSIRLDPPYWFAIALELGLLVVSAKVFPSLKSPLPSVAQTLSHFIYAQDILGYGGILPVFWTLCYEIQFYLLFVTLLVVWQKNKDRLPPRALAIGIHVVLGALFLASIVLRYSGLHLPVRGIALERWFQFFLGVLTYWVVSKRIPLATLVSAFAAVIVGIIVFHGGLIQLLPVIVSAGIVIVGRRDKLDTVLGNRALQFLGRTSYSLYLLHGPIGWRWISLLERVVGPSFGLVWAWIAFASACAISFIASDLTWRLIEAPTMRFSKRIRLPARVELVSEPPLAATGGLSLGGVVAGASPMDSRARIESGVGAS